MTDSTEIQTQSCPKCGEESPVAAVMCWACYSPLGDAKPAPIRLSEASPELRFPRLSWWRGKAEIAARIAVVGALVSSGWWRGKTRYGILGAGLAIVALIAAQQKLGEAKRNRRQSDPRDLQSPICRITDTILLYAIKDKATQVRIKGHPYGVQVEYLIADEWREQMKIPIYVWHSLQNEIQVRAEDGAIRLSLSKVSEQADQLNPLSPDEQNATFSVRILIEPPRAEILLTRI